jgi:hypothetical protein
MAVLLHQLRKPFEGGPIISGVRSLSIHWSVSDRSKV